MPIWIIINFQDGNSPLIEHLLIFHNHSITLVILITIITLWIIVSNKVGSQFSTVLLENQKMEIFWTLAPSLILFFIASPSIKLLFFTEESFNPSHSIKINGFQWYWSYERSQIEEMIQNMDKNIRLRLLTSSNNILIPAKVPLRLIASSSDVIHSWTIPSLGIKADAVPGRLNQMSSIVNFPSILNGQCSEICGANHSFIPILIKAFCLD